jgi:hypothetical protein
MRDELPLHVAMSWIIAGALSQRYARPTAAGLPPSTLTERSSHSGFKVERVTGEWFCYSAGIEDFVRGDQRQNRMSESDSKCQNRSEGKQ